MNMDKKIESVEYVTKAACATEVLKEIKLTFNLCLFGCGAAFVSAIGAAFNTYLGAVFAFMFTAVFGYFAFDKKKRMAYLNSNYLNKNGAI